METLNAKKQALAKHLSCALEDVTATAWDTFEACGGEYRVFTDKEARSAAEEEIKSSLWAFNSGFLVDYMPISDRGGSIVRALAKLQETLCEDANELIAALTHEKFNELVEDAIESDGLGHFLASYDHEEREEIVDGKLFQIFRV